MLIDESGMGRGRDGREGRGGRVKINFKFLYKKEYRPFKMRMKIYIFLLLEKKKHFLVYK